MQRSTGPRATRAARPHYLSVRVWAGSIAAAVIATVAVMSGSCTLDTKTNFCERFGIRCKEGQECAADQAICINIGGCGDGIQQPGEQCDDGNVVDGDMQDGVFVADGCSHDCQSNQECGNGIVDTGEACDHGKLNGTIEDTCDLNCHLVSLVCGNGIVDQDKGEQCDPGAMDSRDCNSKLADQVSPGLGCKAPKCGDGYTNLAAGEKCDSGMVNTATCNGPLCTIPACGDSFTNRAAGEECDTGPDDTTACNGGSAGSKSCHLASCGDGYINIHFIPSGGSKGEECDNAGGGDTVDCNGNNNSDNGPGSCRKPTCGDGYTNKAANEQCDVLGGGDSAECNGKNALAMACRRSACGDGYINTVAGEVQRAGSAARAAGRCTGATSRRTAGARPAPTTGDSPVRRDGSWRTSVTTTSGSPATSSSSSKRSTAAPRSPGLACSR